MSSLKYLVLIFLKQKKGAIAVSFAFMFPFIVGFYSLAFDGSRFNAERSRLADALNQSVYAVAVADNRNATATDKEANVAKVESWLAYYFPDKVIDKKLINVSERLNYNDKGTLASVDYKINANQITHPIINVSPASRASGFAANITLRGNGLNGVVRRTTVVESIPTDYVFVVDFSGSMLDSSAEKGVSREKLLKKVVNQLGEQIFELNNGSTIGFVPFSSGVFTRLDKTNYSSSQGKELGCTYMAKLTSTYESLDWSFWYNKRGRGGGGLSYKTVDDYKKIINEGMATYYRTVIAKSNGFTGSKADDWLINKGYCTEEDGALLCDADSKSNINNPANAIELRKNLSNFMSLSLYDMNFASILSEYTVDIEGTLTGDYLFKDDNVKNFVAFMGGQADLPFQHSCYYSLASGRHRHNLNNMHEIVRNITAPSSYVLDLSTDPDVLTEFSAMTPVGITESLAGVLRAVPLLAKGQNERKVMFVISDGADSHARLRLKMMQDYALCDVIRDGLKNYPPGTPTTSSAIYYISLVDNGTVTDWESNCVGAGNAYVATNLEDLTNVIGSLMFQNSILYINPNDV